MKTYLVQFKDPQGDVIHEEFVYSDFPVAEDGDTINGPPPVSMWEGVSQAYQKIHNDKEMNLKE